MLSFSLNPLLFVPLLLGALHAQSENLCGNPAVASLCEPGYTCQASDLRFGITCLSNKLLPNTTASCPPDLCAGLACPAVLISACENQIRKRTVNKCTCCESVNEIECVDFPFPPNVEPIPGGGAWGEVNSGIQNKGMRMGHVAIAVFSTLVYFFF